MFRENCAAGTIQQLMKPKGAVTGMTTENDRMTREQAEQAQQTFEFPGWLCLSIVDLTATDGSWALKIAPDNNPADFRYYTSVSQWIRECRLDDYYQAMEDAYRSELQANPGADLAAFKQRYYREHPAPSR